MRTSIRDTATTVIDTIEEALRVFPDCRILINTISEQVDNPTLRQKIRSLNTAIQYECSCISELLVVDTAHLPLRDSIHFTVTALKSLASKVMDSVHYINV